MHIARRFSRLIIGLPALAGILGSPPSGYAGTPNPAVNAACPREAVFYNPGNGEDIVVPEGYKVEVFAKDLNFPSGAASSRTALRSISHSTRVEADCSSLTPTRPSARPGPPTIPHAS